ncbi:MAG: hypothetical protein NZM04_01590 [Methylacidiphilales bacterium]|nr:hypothetical protein [Candidatus Methylacidiphilales bacterium]
MTALERLTSCQSHPFFHYSTPRLYKFASESQKFPFGVSQEATPPAALTPNCSRATLAYTPHSSVTSISTYVPSVLLRLTLTSFRSYPPSPPLHALP